MRKYIFVILFCFITSACFAGSTINSLALKGDDGAPGAPGADGDDGAPGPNEVTTSTATNLTGIITGSGSIIGYTADNHSDWDEAHGWGNHADAGYLTTLTFAGLSDYPANDTGSLTNDGYGNLSWEEGSGGLTQAQILTRQSIGF
ncbi:MAG: hypothetical protein V1709_04350 [Planctomycetota bacterium]